MKALRIRFCRVSRRAEKLAEFLGHDFGLEPINEDLGAPGGGRPLNGAKFPAGSSWIEIGPQSEGMPAGDMAQIIVDDADGWAVRAHEHGLTPEGPFDAHGERTYNLRSPDGLSIPFQSELEEEAKNSCD